MTNPLDPAVGVYYKVGDQIFFNKFLAASYATKHGKDLSFFLYNSAFDSCDWSVEPAMSWDQLLDIRAQQIAAKNKPIVLFFSGGTDSYTIYKVFERNRVPIDIIYTQTHENELDSFRKVFDLFSAGLYDKNTKIVNRDEKNAIDSIYDDEEWIWKKGVRYQFKLNGMGDIESSKQIERILGRDDFISVVGFEKPRLHFDRTGVYSYQDDENYARPMGDPRLDCFYISPELPELHIKQSYMLLKYVKSLDPMAKYSQDLSKFNSIHSPSHHDWTSYSIKGCGRYGDLNDSFKHHIGNQHSQFTLPTTMSKFDGSEYRGRFKSHYKSLVGSKQFANYTNGLMSVVSDSSGKFLLSDSTNFYSMKQFRSKYYKLNF